MTETDGRNMICPKCGQFQSKAETCSKCGVIIARLRTEVEEDTSAEERNDGEPDPVVGSEQQKPLPFVARAALIAGGIIVLIVFYLALVPVDMSVEEFVEAKKSDFHFRRFRVEGTVEIYDSFVVVQASDGRDMSSLKIGDGDISGYVTYDRDAFSYTPKNGDLVKVSGSFERVPFYSLNTRRMMTIATASSIEPLDR